MTKRFAHGLVIGTFYPAHIGHLALIRAALSACDRVTVEVLGGSTESLPVPLRVEWLREETPTARIASIVDDSEIDFESASAWDHHTAVIRRLLDPADGPVSAVFTSDAYGEELARRLGAAWVRVDPDRSALTVSSTAVRADVAGHWWALPAPVRQHLAKRVVVVDAEPTGTTTLAAELAHHFGVPCVPQMGRMGTDLGAVGSPVRWPSAVDNLVAAHQARREDDAARRSPRPLLFCDADPVVTAVRQGRPSGSPSAIGMPFARIRVPALYLLSGSDGRLSDLLAHQPAPWVELSGSSRAARLADGIRAVDEVLAAGWGLMPSLEQQQKAGRGQ